MILAYILYCYSSISNKSLHLTNMIILLHFVLKPPCRIGYKGSWNLKSRLHLYMYAYSVIYPRIAKSLWGHVVNFVHVALQLNLSATVQIDEYHEAPGTHMAVSMQSHLLEIHVYIMYLEIIYSTKCNCCWLLHSIGPCICPNSVYTCSTSCTAEKQTDRWSLSSGRSSNRWLPTLTRWLSYNPPIKLNYFEIFATVTVAANKVNTHTQTNKQKNKTKKTSYVLLVNWMTSCVILDCL